MATMARIVGGTVFVGGMVFVGEHMMVGLMQRSSLKTVSNSQTSGAQQSSRALPGVQCTVQLRLTHVPPLGAPATRALRYKNSMQPQSRSPRRVRTRATRACLVADVKTLRADLQHVSKFSAVLFYYLGGCLPN